MRAVTKLLCAGLLCTAVAIGSGPAFALDPYDPPQISCEKSGQHQITLLICGGKNTGSPAGVTVQWKKLSDWVADGGPPVNDSWADVDGDLCKLSLSGQPSMQHPGKSRWEFLPGDPCEEFEFSDMNFHETGVSASGCGLDPFECGTDYIFRAFSHAGRGFGRSVWTDKVICNTLPCDGEGCTFTQGYWGRHGPDGCRGIGQTNNWPSSILTGGMDLGNHHYTAAQLCCILNTPAKGNALNILAVQLIAVNLNMASGASSCDAVKGAIAGANGAIGDHWVPTDGSCTPGSDKVTAGCPLTGNDCTPESYAELMDQYNNGTLGGCPPHCAELFKRGGTVTPENATPVQKSTWGRLKIIYR